MNTLKLSIYPRDYFAFADGEPIHDFTVNEWVQEVIDKLESEPHKDFEFLASGNAIVVVLRMRDELNGGYSYKIIVSKDYYTDTTFWIPDKKE